MYPRSWPTDIGSKVILTVHRIISLVLEWDTGDFRKAADSIKRSKERPEEAQLTAIDEHLQATREKHESIRHISQSDGKSIVVAILEAKDETLVESLTETQHTQCLEYYSAQLAIRDREKITEALCRQTPDLITSMVRDGVSVFEPMIRTIHKNVDIRKHISSVESFLTDLIETSKPKKRDDGENKCASAPPSVEDFVALLRRNRQLAYNYLHEFAEGCPDLRTTWLDWAKKSLESFRQTGGTNDDISTDNGSDSSPCPGGADKRLQNLFRELPDGTQTNVRAAIDAHAKYLSILEGVSMGRMQSIISGIGDYEKSRAGGSMGGPGVYITRWHCLLDETIVTPSTPRGQPRRGKDVKTLKALGKTEAIVGSETWDPDALTRQEEQEWPEPPDVSIVVEALGTQFKSLVAEISARDLLRK